MTSKEFAEMKAELEAVDQSLQAARDTASSVYTPKVKQARELFELACEPHRLQFERERGEAADEYNRTMRPIEAEHEKRRGVIRLKYDKGAGK